MNKGFLPLQNYKDSLPWREPLGKIFSDIPHREVSRAVGQEHHTASPVMSVWGSEVSTVMSQIQGRPSVQSPRSTHQPVNHTPVFHLLPPVGMISVVVDL